MNSLRVLVRFKIDFCFRDLSQNTNILHNVSALSVFTLAQHVVWNSNLCVHVEFFVKSMLNMYICIVHVCVCVCVCACVCARVPAELHSPRPRVEFDPL